MKIRTKFILFTLLIAATFAGIRIFDRVTSGRKLLLDRTITRTEYSAAFFADLAGDYLERDRKARLIEVLGAVKNLKQVARFSLFDSTGNELYRMAAPGVRVDKKQVDKDIAAASDETYRLKREIIRNGKYLGYIEMEVTLEGINASMETLLWRSLFLNLISILVLLAVVWLLTLRLGKGLETLHQLAANINVKTLPATHETELEPDIADIAVSLRQLHSGLRAEEEKRKKVEQVKNDFFAMTVHDLRQPVTSLKASLELLLPEEERRNFGEKALKDLSYVAQASVTRLNTMITDLLNVAKLANPDYPLKKETVEMDDFLRECAEENSASVVAAGKKWRFSMPTEIKDCRIHADGKLLNRVIGNLVLNAIQYTPAGGHITLGARFMDGRRKVGIYVSDEGSGIPENFRDELFKKFSSLSTNIANAGLGLAFCAMVAERHSASMAVESETGKGTEISFIIPVSSGDPGPEHSLLNEPSANLS